MFREFTGSYLASCWLLACAADPAGGGSETGFVGRKTSAECLGGEHCTPEAAPVPDSATPMGPDGTSAEPTTVSACLEPPKLQGPGPWTLRWSADAEVMPLSDCGIYGQPDMPKQSPGVVAAWTAPTSGSFTFRASSATLPGVIAGPHCQSSAWMNGCSLFGPQTATAGFGGEYAQGDVVLLTIQHVDVEQRPMPDSAEVELTIEP